MTMTPAANTARKVFLFVLAFLYQLLSVAFRMFELSW